MRKSILIAVLVVTVIAILSFKNSSQKSEAKHLRVALFGSLLITSYSHGEYTEEKIHKDRSGNYDMGPFLKRISELETQGWEIISSNSDDTKMWVHMKRNSD